MNEPSSDVLSKEALAKAFRSVTQQQDFAKKLEWWLISPHAAERWLQFELAYALSNAYAGKYFVACEIERADLVVLNSNGTSPLWKGTPVAKLELKMIGNWCVQEYQISGFQADITKVRGYKVPSLALACCVEVRGESKCDHYDWCFDSVKSQGKASLDEVIAALAGESRVSLESIETVTLRPTGNTAFDSMQLRLSAYRNELAQTQ